MKLSRSVFVLATCSALLLVACGQGAGPGKTAIEMFEKVCKTNDYSAMLEYVAPESAALMGIGIGMMKDKGAAKDAAYCKPAIKVVSEKITDNTAVVVLNTDEKPMDWKKIDGKWKFYIKK